MPYVLLINQKFIINFSNKIIIIIIADVQLEQARRQGPK
jgi:hypothetical protein